MTRWSASGWSPQPVAFQGRGGKIVANPNGALRRADIAIGRHLTFRIFNVTNQEGVLRFGDVVFVQAPNGRFIAMDDFGRIRADRFRRDGATHFRLVSHSGADTDGTPIQQRVSVRFQQAPLPDLFDATRDLSSTSRFFLGFGEDGSVRAVGADDPNGRFTLSFQAARPVHLIFGAHIVTAEGGGGRILTSSRSEKGMWEGFSLRNVSRPGSKPQAGDTITLETVDGSFVTMARETSGRPVEGAPLKATTRVQDPTTQFVIRSIDTTWGPIQVVTLGAASDPSGRVALEGDRLVWRRAPLPGAEIQITILPGEQEPTLYRWQPASHPSPARPYAERPVPAPQSRRILVYPFNTPSLGPWLWTARALRAELLDTRRFGVQRFLAANTGGAFTVSGATVLAPVFRPDGLTNTQVWETADAALGSALARAVQTRSAVNSDEIILLAADANPKQAQMQSVNFRSSRGTTFRDRQIVIGMSSPEGDQAWRGVLAHEVSHFLWPQDDRYRFPSVLRGDVAAWPQPNSAATAWGPPEDPTRNVDDLLRLRIVREVGVGPLTAGDRISLELAERRGQFLQVAPEVQLIPGVRKLPSFVNVDRRGTVFRIERADRRVGPITSGSMIRLVAEMPSGELAVGVPNGEYNPLRGQLSWPRNWGVFRFDVRPGSTAEPGAEVILVTNAGAGDVVIAEPQARTSDGDLTAVNLDRGYYIAEDGRRSATGRFDNASLHGANLVAAHDRISNGFAQVRYLTPDDRGCFALDPFLDRRETIVLFDPGNATEWYTVEHRRFTSETDEVPTGFVVMWMNADPNNWESYFRKLNDRAPLAPTVPAMVSALHPGAAMNVYERPLSLAPFDFLDLESDRSVFGSPTSAQPADRILALPLGDGSPSRFAVTFSVAGSNGHMCIH